jgi:hypothetical protein
MGAAIGVVGNGGIGVYPVLGADDGIAYRSPADGGATVVGALAAL